MEARLPLPAASSAAGQAREAVRTILAEWGMASCLDDALLVVSELVTNAVRHGAAPVEMRLSRVNGDLRVDVRDSLPDVGPKLMPLGSAEPDGRGLVLVAGASKGWGWEADEHSKTVWAQIDCSPDSAV